MANALISEKNRNREEIEALEVAEAAREQEWTHPSFVAELFMGKLRLDSIVPFPTQDPTDRKAGDEFLAKLEHFLKTELDADKVDREGQIPQSVMDGLAKLGAFGIKIPKEYGGLGLSQTNYDRALAMIAGHCGSTAVTVSAHQSIGVPQPLLLFGTEAQKRKYLPQFAKGAISAFALTEPEVGSDPARLSTTAVPVDGGESYVINGTKLWCTNGAIADIIVVMAQTPPVVVNGREKKQITAFIVERNTPGFEVVHRCRFMGLNGIQNALLRFTNLKVPKENVIWGLGKGLKLALITLNTGRLSLPAGCVGAARKALAVAREWGNERKQWGAPVGVHEAGAVKIAGMSADLLAMEATTWLSCAWADRHDRDIRLEAAMTKLFTSLRWEHTVQELVQLRGGRGYETGPSLAARGEKNIPVERWVRDSRINQIVEGTNEILKLFIAREALDRHLKIAGDVMNPKVPLGQKLGAALKAAVFYAVWYPKLWLGSLFPSSHGVGGKLGAHVRYIDRTSKRLARATFHLMMRNGPKLEKKQMQLGRLVDIATDLYAMAATIGMAAGRMPQNAMRPNAEDSADYFCREARERIAQNFAGVACNDDAKANALAKRVLAGELVWQEEAT